MLSRFKIFKVSHCFREANRLVDWLVNKGAEVELGDWSKDHICVDHREVPDFLRNEVLACQHVDPGEGEAIIRATVARDVITLMDYKNLSLQDSIDYVTNKRLEDGKGGLIAVSSNGEVVAGFNTMGKFRACAIEAGYYEIGI
ncbi:hypothetical protein SUGI_0334580 [Cryptomeria japonica]|nr:hypothetical protein SUGI_0334580 [Cryptomeria japonica]